MIARRGAPDWPLDVWSRQSEEVVATPVGGLREQIVPEVTGILTRDVTAQGIADAIRRLAEDREFLLRMRQSVLATKGARSIDRFFNELNNIALKEG